MSEWIRVTRSKRCPICGKPDWCSISADGTAACCARIVEGSILTTNGGYVHRLTDTIPQHELPPKDPPRPDIDVAAIMRRFQAAITSQRRTFLAGHLGVSPESLAALAMGWSYEHHAYAFPMRDAYRRIIGIRLRDRDGRKWAVRGSRNGLFLPVRGRSDCLLVCEGESDTAAAITLGFDAIGRPGCTNGADLIVELLKREQHSGQIVVLGDSDRPGVLGAISLCDRLRDESIKSTTFVPPAKDVRAWLIAGATKQDVKAAISPGATK